MGNGFEIVFFDWIIGFFNIQYSLIQGKFDIAKKLIEAGADVNLISQVEIYPIEAANFWICFIKSF